MSTEIIVGEPFPVPPPTAGFEGSYFQSDRNGCDLRVYVRGVSHAEAIALRTEVKYEFGLLQTGQVLLLPIRATLPPKPAIGRYVARDLFEMDAPYSWHLVREAYRPTIAELDALGQASDKKATVFIQVIDALTNVVVALRIVRCLASEKYEELLREARAPSMVDHAFER